MHSAMKPISNPLLELADHGQAVWLDYISRDLISSGELKTLIEHDHVTGLTSNPAIFAEAMLHSTDYEFDIQKHDNQRLRSSAELYDKLVIDDIKLAADSFSQIYRTSDRRDGYVSLEVSPYLAYSTEATIEQARWLWNQVQRPNLMIKVPATPQGIPAIQTLLAEGINVNVTLLFSTDMYQRVVEAWLSALEQRLAQGLPLFNLASVASFFVSRVDTSSDTIINRRLHAETDEHQAALLSALRGRVAIANARLAYDIFEKCMHDPRWKALSAAGAQPQRLLWASTSSKNPEYGDVLYVEGLVADKTVNTMPMKTLSAFREHGEVHDAFAADSLSKAQEVMASLESAKIDLNAITDKLLDDGVRKFIQAYDQVIDAIEERRVKQRLFENVSLHGQLDLAPPLMSGEHLSFYTGSNFSHNLAYYTPNPHSIDLLRIFLNELRPGSYFSLLAYLYRLEPEQQALLQDMRHAVQEQAGVRTHLGYGPRYQHTLSRAFKDDPVKGVFLVVTAEQRTPVTLPSDPREFARLETVQAISDFQILQKRGRGALRIHINGDVTYGLSVMRELIMTALISPR